ncbi:MAG TPA: zinc ribbon domain-containing protein [Pyrinomonadaceae bacterium]|nr:zinc ribbon domain-containing protein [Pyrinomonadaceae bacterium]
MSEPEIARRCSHCGASIRERAFFCPQCGKAVQLKSSESGGHSIESIDPVKVDAEQCQTEGALDDAPDRTMPLTTKIPTLPSDAAQNVAVQPARALPPKARTGQPREMDRVRKISSVVIEQATYDPSLRFILVAAVLFLLFIVILVMSKLIG